MKIYIRKIDNQCIEKQISYTKEILRGFLDNQEDHSTITCIGKTSGEQAQVALLLATDPRFDNSIQKILRAEGDLAIGDLMVMYKATRNKYIVELIKPSDSRHASYLSLFENDRHVLMSVDTIEDIESTSEYADVFEHNLYGIHIKEKNDALAEDRPHICIGWSRMGDLTTVSTKEELAIKHDETWPELNTRAKGQNIGQVWCFIKEMKIGDYVIFADGDFCHIGRIESDYYFDGNEYPNQSADYANVRNVKWLKTNIKRSDLSETFHHSLMTAKSVWRLNDYKSVIYELLNDNYIKEEFNIEEADLLVEDNPDKLLSAAELVEKLNEMYNSANARTQSNAIRMFGFKYAESIIKCGVTPQKLVDDSDIDSNSYGAEIQKAINMYNSIKNNEYGVAFSENIEYTATAFDYETTVGKGINKILYGTPGCGKSFHIDHNILGKDIESKEYVGEYNKENIVRTTFYQDYSNTDFVGQILPKIKEHNEEKIVEYIFNPGPFTLALIRAISNPNKKVALVVEEINRGNAPAIFGDVFQLLDRDENSISEYGIVNVGVMDYLNSYEFEVDGEKKYYKFDEIKIPGNMDIFATMNTSDQNVYTLDTAFTRRWNKERIENNFNENEIKDMLVPGMEKYTWKEFVDGINNRIQDKLEDLQVNEDKQVGAFFVKKADLLPKDGAPREEAKIKAFAYKVLEYLWDDVSKLDHSVIFNSNYNTFEKLVDGYVKNGVAVFANGIFQIKSEITANEIV